MGKKTPAPPAPIDYSAAATAQGQANLASALQGSYLSNPNIINPYGSSTTTWGEAKDASGNVIPGQTQATVRQELNPDAAAALASQQEVQKQLADLSLQGTNLASRQLGTPFSYDPSKSLLNTTGPQAQAYTPSAALGALNYGPKAGEYGTATGNLDLSNVAAMPVNAGMTGQNAILSRLAPQIRQTEAATAQRLANQGITQGSEAYRNAMTAQGQQANDLYTQAALQGIGLDMGANQQGYGQALSSAGLYNQAIGQNFGQGVTSTGLYNQAQGQAANQQMAQESANREAQNQIFNQQMASANFENAARQNDLQMQLGLYNQPLNQINSLMSGSQIQNPTFQAYSGSNVNAAPVFQAAQQTGQDAQAAYAQQVAAANAKMAALGALGGAATSALIKSDIRLKSKIIRVGTHPRGIGIYEYDIDGRRERGVIAQEVERVLPSAVIEHPDGYKMVDYGAL
ncbi:hypothetical protein UFOVP1545_14 [uncultured Caudovirales phage]|uniref:Peptidase S74 domain-containing protein n=1 Tax=uncultured Caudovirales phage TaxID=2100421 RepID=A0A6J7XHI6_9CAUD|nr:hypothetical protein UFOVP1545_14 [uncultured Caudovirales phage]